MRATGRVELLSLSMAIVLTTAIFALRVLDVLRDRVLFSGDEPMDDESLNRANFEAFGDTAWERFGDLNLERNAMLVAGLLLLLGLRVRQPLRVRAAWAAAVFVGVVLVAQIIAHVTMPHGSWRHGFDSGGTKLAFLVAYIALLVALWRGLASSSVQRRLPRKRTGPGRRIGIGILREDE